MTADILSIVEAAYDVERVEDAWLGGLLDATSAVIDTDDGVGGYLYDASAGPIRTWGHAVRGGLDLTTLVAGCATFDDDFRRASWLTRRFGSLSEFPELVRDVARAEVFAKLGIRDASALNALDPSGLGCWIVAPRGQVRLPSDADRDRWTRVASHLAAAVRLRARLRADAGATAAEAVLTPNGKVEEARGEAQDGDARVALRDAALTVERARGELRRENVARSLASWPALVRGRWTLVDHFESDGRRYVLAYTNASSDAVPKLLSARERDVLEWALLGHENKLIAYELGIAASTVRVLMRRAGAKLGAKTRVDAIAAYKKLRAP